MEHSMDIQFNYGIKLLVYLLELVFTFLFFFLNHKILLKICLTLKGFATVCTAGILLPLKYTIGIRLSPEEEIRGLDYIGKFSKKTCL